MFRDGEQVGPFIIQNHLITGGCSEVYRASANGRFVALKFLREDKSHQPLLPLRMANESLGLSKYKRPGVVEIIQDGQHDGRPFIALELLPCSLAQRLPVTTRQAVSIAKSIARTLASLHADGIVHRDLKPQNVMLTEDDQPKLIDFGVAKFPIAASTLEEPLLPLSTEPGGFFGTLEYAAPEQIADAKHVDGRADVYSLGIILFEMLAHRRPFTAKEKGRLISMHMNDIPPLVSSLRPGLPSELTFLVARMLAKDSAVRPCAGEVAEALARISFTPQHSRAVWIRALILSLVPLYPAPTPSKLSIERWLESCYDQFEIALFTARVEDAEVQLSEAEEVMKLLGSTPAQQHHQARLRYKQAALAKERGAIREAIQLFAESSTQWRMLLKSQPGKAYKALSICADGIGEMDYHLGDYERALSMYQDAAHTLPRTLAAAQTARQVPSFLDYQRALVYRDQGNTDAALASLQDAEAHERVLLAQENDAPADRWQLGRVLTLRTEILLQQHDEAGAYAAANEAERVTQEAQKAAPADKRFRLGHLMALDRLIEVTEAAGQKPKGSEAEPLAELQALVQSDPDNGQLTHALVESLLRRAQYSGGASRRDFAQQALTLMQQMESRCQWQGDVHIARWRERATELANR